MLTSRRERSAVPRRRRRPDGPADAAPLGAGLPVRGGGRARRHAGARRACSARTWWCSATATASSACWTSIARTAARRSRSAATRSAACAASITAGRSTSRATCVEMASEPAGERPVPQGQAQGLSGARGRRLRLGLHGTGRDDAGVRAAAVRADAATPRQHRQDPRQRATGRRSWKGRSIPRTARPCIRPTWCRRGSTAPRRPTRPGCGRRPTRRRATRCERDQLRLPLRRDPPADRERRRRTTTSASRSTSRRSPR